MTASAAARRRPSRRRRASRTGVGGGRRTIGAVGRRHAVAAELAPLDLGCELTAGALGERLRDRLAGLHPPRAEDVRADGEQRRSSRRSQTRRTVASRIRGVDDGDHAAEHPRQLERVSNWAKARPWLASGASRCTIESNASRPSAAAKFTTKASRIAGDHAAEQRRTEPGDGGEAERADEDRLLVRRPAQHAARSRCRSSPRSVTIAIASPTSAVPAVLGLQPEASRKKQKPTDARSSAIALGGEHDAGRLAARPSPRASAAWRRPPRAAASSRSTTATDEDDRARRPSARCDVEQLLAERRRRRRRRSRTRRRSGPSFEFASTRSASLRTTDGTSADLEMLCVFCSTRPAKASGYSEHVVDVERHQQQHEHPAAGATSCITSRAAAGHAGR